MTKTFRQPPSDESFLLPHWIHFNARESPDHPLFVYGDECSGPKSITWSDAARGFGRSARMVKALTLPEQCGESPQVFGILAHLDPLTYYTLATGILMAGSTAFLISTRNSPAAVSHLLKKTGTHKLFVSTDEQMQLLASTALSDAVKEDHHVELLSIPALQYLFPENAEDEDKLPDYPKRPLDSPAFILHSSGSTAFPKPITMSHRMLLEIARAPAFVNTEMSQVRFSVHALPVFHALAFHPFIAAPYNGTTICFFPPRTPPLIPSPQNVLNAAVACKCNILFCVPLFVELWSRSVHDVENLKLMDSVVYAGGPLNKKIGDELSLQGVPLATLYGMTELGPGCTVVINNVSAEWDWTNARQDIQTVYLPQEGDPGIFEIAFVETPLFAPAVFNMEIEGKRAFATNDLVIRHPTNPTKFKIYGRKDEQIMLSTGEKTNPGPMEMIICRHPFVQAALMFGRGRSHNGIIIRPVKAHEIDPIDPVALAKFRNDIWSSVEEANTFAPSHSRLYKEMIIVTHPSKPFETTAKLTPRRPVVLKDYETEIDVVYAAAEESAQTGIPPPSEWTPSQVLSFVRRTVQHIMGVKVEDGDDLFLRGGDSLIATYIRNSLIHALRQTRKEPAGGIAQSFVYSNPSIALLAKQLLAIIESPPVIDAHNIPSRLKALEEMIAEFSADFPQHRPSTCKAFSAGEIVLITGTTGALGAQLLANLVSLSDISHIYAFNRKIDDGRKSLQERQLEALEERGLDPQIIFSKKVTLVEGDTAAEGLGILPPLFNEIRDSVTLIIHNAWRVNFNLKLGSFKPLIRGVRNLIDLALHSPRPFPPRLMFMGSVGVFRNHKAPGRPLETPIEDPKVVLGTGYSESKFVAERVLHEAGRLTPLRSVTVRIGQMTSNSSGAWNPGDWLPAIVRSGQILGALPARDDSVAWIGLDIAAKAIIDFRTSKSQYLHLAHPTPTPWNTLFSAFASSLNVPLIGWAEWLSRLEKNPADPKTNPATHLLDFFRACSTMAKENFEAPGAPLLDLTQALKSSPTLTTSQLCTLGVEDVGRWVGYWKQKGFLSP